jgi:hypothetical protein
MQDNFHHHTHTGQLQLVATVGNFWRVPTRCSHKSVSLSVFENFEAVVLMLVLNTFFQQHALTQYQMTYFDVTWSPHKDTQVSWYNRRELFAIHHWLHTLNKAAVRETDSPSLADNYVPRRWRGRASHPYHGTLGQIDTHTGRPRWKQRQCKRMPRRPRHVPARARCCPWTDHVASLAPPPNTPSPFPTHPSWLPSPFPFSPLPLFSLVRGHALTFIINII